MKTTTKKILISILAIVCVMALSISFVACGASDTTNTSEQINNGDQPPTQNGNTPPNGQQGSFPGGQQGGFPGGQQGGFPGGQAGGNVTAADVTSQGVSTADIEAQIDAYEFDLEFDDVTDYSALDVISVDLSTLTEDYVIKASGNYVFTGTTEYRVVLGTKNIEIHIWLNNATLDSIFADKKPTSTVITLVGENVMTGVLSDANDDSKGTLYVKNDLLINGDGSLTIASGADKNGVHCTGKLVIEDATLDITAGKHGVRGNDAVILKNANLDIAAGTDGIQTDNETDDVSVGYIYIEDSDIDIVSGDDGISAATLLYIKSGNINITTNGGAPSRITETSSDNADGKGLKAGSIKLEVADADLSAELAKGNRQVDAEEEADEGYSIVEITDVSYYALVIEGGNITINANDDAIHSNGYLFISGGTLNLTSGDDGVHADELLRVTGGTIVVNNCYEGLEAAKLEIAGGNITVTAQDDGLNAADGTNAQMGYANQNCYIIISGGKVKVNAQGDGIDSNNGIYISGGEVYVDGPTNGGNSSLDSEAGIVIDGGTVVAVGASGMVETPSTGSAQNVIVYQGNSIQAGSTIVIKDASGNTLVEYTTAKASQVVIASSSSFTTGNTYSVYVNGTNVGSVTLSSTVTSVGTQGGMQQGGQPRR